MPYIHELPDWPNFRWDMNRLGNLLAETRCEQGRLLGRNGSCFAWDELLPRPTLCLLPFCANQDCGAGRSSIR